MKNRLIGHLVFLIFLVISNSALSCVSERGTYRKDIENKDNRYSGTLTTECNAGTDLVEQASLKFDWWFLMGQPVYQYAFTWYKNFENDLFISQTGNYIRWDEIKKYPDLVKRYKSLEPSNVVVSFEVGFKPQENAVGQETHFPTKHLSICLKDNCYYSAEVSGSVTLKGGNRVTVTSAGNIGYDISPGSPSEPRDFVDWDPNCFDCNYRGDNKIMNKRTLNTFKYAQSLYFHNLEIDYDLPNIQLEALYNELQRRLGKEADPKVDVNPGDDWIAKVVDDNNNTYIFSGSTESLAEGKALSQCSKLQGSSCAIVETIYRGPEKDKAKIDNKNKPDLSLLGVENSNENNKKNADAGGKNHVLSLLLLIDVSGSMSGGKLEQAKKAAIQTIKKVVPSNFEVGVIAFSGDCSSPVNSQHAFSRDATSLIRFVDGLNAVGGTPLGSALSYAHNFIRQSKSAHSREQMVILLADGDDSCGNINSAMSELLASGTVFRHETIGLEIGGNQKAESQLKTIARQTGGDYRAAASQNDLNRVFSEAIETMQMMNMLGSFGRRNTPDDKSSIDSTRKQLLDGLDF